MSFLTNTALIAKARSLCIKSGISEHLLADAIRERMASRKETAGASTIGIALELLDKHLSCSRSAVDVESILQNRIQEQDRQ